MELDALLLDVEGDARAPLEQQKAEKKTPKEQLTPRKQRRTRMRRMDVACLAVVGLVACFITVRQPELRQDNPLWRTSRKISRAQDGEETVAEGFLWFRDFGKEGFEVEESSRGVKVGGKKTLVIAEEMPYAKVEVEEWEEMLTKVRRGGSNAVVVDVEWEAHEPLPGEFHLSGNADLAKLLELVAREELFVHLRFSPRGCASVSNDVEVWKSTTERFMNVILSVSRPFLAGHGGPIITTELVVDGCSDNEAELMAWTEQLLQRLDTSTLWISARGELSPTSVMIPACKSAYDCERFAASHQSTCPLVWTRATPSSQINSRDLAYNVARWFAMGGTVFSDQTALEIVNASDIEDAGNAQSRMAQLRHTLAKCSEALVTNEVVIEDVDYSSLIPNRQRAYTYGDQLAFLENPANTYARVAFRGAFVDLAAQSVVITNGTSVLFNSSAVLPAPSSVLPADPASSDSIAAVSR